MCIRDRSVAILQQIPMSIEEAAISLGASKMKAFFRITVPMMASGIISGAILSWVTMISELSTAIILYTGKTKTLISLVSEAIEKEQGNVVCIEKSRHLTYDIPYQARLIRTDDYGVRGNTMLLGFLCGLHAGNYDITHFFIDDLNKILDDRSNEALEKFLDTLSAFGERENINFTITITADPSGAGDGLKKYF